MKTFNQITEAKELKLGTFGKGGGLATIVAQKSRVQGVTTWSIFARMSATSENARAKKVPLLRGVKKESTVKDLIKAVQGSQAAKKFQRAGGVKWVTEELTEVVKTSALESIAQALRTVAKDASLGPESVHALRGGFEGYQFKVSSLGGSSEVNVFKNMQGKKVIQTKGNVRLYRALESKLNELKKKGFEIQKK